MAVKEPCCIATSWAELDADECPVSCEGIVADGLAHVDADASGLLGRDVGPGALPGNEGSCVEIDAGGSARVSVPGVQADSMLSEVITPAGKVRDSSRSKLLSLAARRPRTRDSRSQVAARRRSRLIVAFMVVLLQSDLVPSQKTP
jgi:hypothetical protein